LNIDDELIAFAHSYSRQNGELSSKTAALYGLFKVLAIDETILRNSLTSSVSDYEDAVIEASALKNNIDCIISRVSTYTPEQFFLL